MDKGASILITGILVIWVAGLIGVGVLLFNGSITGFSSHDVEKKIAECTEKLAKLTSERDAEISKLTSGRDAEISKMQSDGKSAEEIVKKQAEWDEKISKKQSEWAEKIDKQQKECDAEVAKLGSEAEQKAAESEAKLGEEIAGKQEEADKKAAEAAANIAKRQAQCNAEIVKIQREGSAADTAKKIAECRTEIAKLQAEAAKKQAELERKQAEILLKSHAEEGRRKQISLELISDEDEAGEGGRKIKFMSINAKSELRLEGLNESKARVKLSDGTTQDINILPNTAFKIALEKLRSENLNVRIEELDKEIAAVYVVEADKTVRVLGLFDIKSKLEVEIDIKDGKIKFDKPWWWFLVEEKDEIKDLDMQLIKPIQDIILQKNEEAHLFLNEYFLNAESYSAYGSDSKNIKLKIDKNLLTIAPENDWTGTTSVTIRAIRGEKILDSVFNIIVSENNLSVQTVQHGAILGEPVKWEKKVKVAGLEKVTLKLPKDSENIVVKKETEIISNVSIIETPTDVEIEVEEDEDYQVEYFTEAPSSVEESLSEVKKRITIVGSEEVHYTDILAFKHLHREVPNGLVKLFWITPAGKKEVELAKYDLNENGLVDYIEWTVPTLSNETYELEFNILNIQSYPTVGGNWEVLFNTSGVANLTITAINGTTYGTATPDDLTPLELRCGSDVLIFSWQGDVVSYTDWNCTNQLGYWTVKVLTPGVHIQEFDFGGLIGHAFNFASENISFVPPTPANNTAQNMNWVYVNITSQENLNDSLLEWGNSSGYFNLTMSNISAAKWFRNMTSLADGNYNFTVWGHNGTWNVTGIRVQSVRRFVTIDTVAPTTSIMYPQNTTYNAVSDLNYTTNGVYCWYSTDGGVTNSSPVTCPTNFTGVTSVAGTNAWTVYANDSAGNVNSTSVTFTIDTTAPTVSFTCSKSSVEYGQTITCSCSAADNADTSPALDYKTSPPVNQLGHFTTSCTVTDDAGNFASAIFAYSVVTPDSGNPVFTASSADLTKGYNKVMLKDWQAKLTIDDEQHVLLIKKIADKKNITIVLSSNQLDMNIGDERLFDLNKDGYDDISIKLNSIEQFRANLTIRSMEEDAYRPAQQQVPQQNVKEEKPKKVSTPSVFDSISDFWSTLFSKFTGKMIEKLV